MSCSLGTMERARVETSTLSAACLNAELRSAEWSTTLLRMSALSCPYRLSSNRIKNAVACAWSLRTSHSVSCITSSAALNLLWKSTMDS